MLRAGIQHIPTLRRIHATLSTCMGCSANNKSHNNHPNHFAEPLAQNINQSSCPAHAGECWWCASTQGESPSDRVLQRIAQQRERMVIPSGVGENVLVLAQLKSFKVGAVGDVEIIVPIQQAIRGASAINEQGQYSQPTWSRVVAMRKWGNRWLSRPWHLGPWRKLVSVACVVSSEGPPPS